MVTFVKKKKKEKKGRASKPESATLMCPPCPNERRVRNLSGVLSLSLPVINRQPCPVNRSVNYINNASSPVRDTDELYLPELLSFRIDYLSLPFGTHEIKRTDETMTFVIFRQARSDLQSQTIDARRVLTIVKNKLIRDNEKTFLGRSYTDREYFPIDSRRRSKKL